MERAFFKSLTRAFDSRKNKNVSLIINIRGKSLPKERGSILTEFYELDEADQIMSGMKEAGIIVHLYTNEIEYLIDKLQGEERDLVAFNLGRNGVSLTKKSLIPMICSVNHLKYTGSDAYVTALCRNKFHYTFLLESLDVRIPRTEVYFSGYKCCTKNKLNSQDRVIVKPAYEAASRGIHEDSVLSYSDTLQIQHKVAELFQEFQKHPVLVQEFIEGFEIEVPIFVHQGKPEALMPVGLSIKNTRYIGNQILDYTRSSLYDYEYYNYAEEDHKTSNELVKEAKRVASLLGIKGYGRVDFRVDSNGKYYVIDISTHPFIMSHSSFAYALEKMNIPYSDLFKCIIECSLS